MKRLVIVVIAVAVIVGVLGSTALAGKPEDGMNPVEQLLALVLGMDSKLGDVDSTLEDMDSRLEDMEANMVRMETDSGNIVIPAYTDRFDLTEIGGDYDETRHVVVTLHVYPGSLDETGDRIWVSAYWPGNILGWDVAMFDSNSDYKAATFEFNADYWIIDCESVGTGYTVNYVVTTTYVPAAS